MIKITMLINSDNNNNNNMHMYAEARRERRGVESLSGAGNSVGKSH